MTEERPRQQLRVMLLVFHVRVFGWTVHYPTIIALIEVRARAPFLKYLITLPRRLNAEYVVSFVKKLLLARTVQVLLTTAQQLEAAVLAASLVLAADAQLLSLR